MFIYPQLGCQCERIMICIKPNYALAQPAAGVGTRLTCALPDCGSSRVPSRYAVAVIAE